MQSEKEFLLDFSILLKKLRKTRGLKMENFSFDANIDFVTLYRAETGVNIKIYTAYKILKTLDIDLLEMLREEDKKWSQK
jgi:predicted transcriptional regulator